MDKANGWTRPPPPTLPEPYEEAPRLTPLPEEPTTVTTTTKSKPKPRPPAKAPEPTPPAAPPDELNGVVIHSVETSPLWQAPWERYVVDPVGLLLGLHAYDSDA